MDLNFNSDVFNDALILLEDKCVSINGKTLCQLGLPGPVRTGFRVLDRDVPVSYTHLDVYKRQL